MLLLRQQLSLDAYIRSLGPAGWWRMDQGVTVTGAGISQVDDLSGNARHLLDPGTTRPIYLPYSGTRYLYLPGVAGNYASTPDSAANSITGDIAFVAKIAATDYTPSAATQIISKFGGAGNRSFSFFLTTTGALVFWYSADGTANTTIASTATVGITDGADKWVACTVDVDNGSGGHTVQFFLSDDGASWTQLGSSVTNAGVISLFDGAAPVEIGTYGGSNGPFSGKVYRAKIFNAASLAGSPVVDFNPADADGDGDTSFASSTTGETWTINSSGSLPAQIVGRASALFNGTSHYLKCNAFTLNQPTCVLWVGKQVSWTAFDYFCDGNTADSAIIRQVTATPQVGIYAGTSLGNVSLTLSSLGVIAAVFNGASSSVRLNKGSPVSGNAGAGNPGGFTLGAAANGANPSNIQVYETVIFPIAPSTAQLDRLIAGLMARHGVA